MKNKKIFVGIVTYGDAKRIIDLFNLNYDKNFTYHILYNKSSKKKEYKKLLNYFKDFDNVVIERKFKVYWGTYSILGSHLYLMQKFLDSKCDIFCSLDNNAVIIDKNKIKNISNNDYFLNLMQSPKCVYLDLTKSYYENRVKNNSNDQHYKKYRKSLDEFGHKSKLSKIYYPILRIGYNFFIHPICFFKSVIILLKGKKQPLMLKRLPVFANKKEPFEIELLNPFTISGNYCFTRHQVQEMFNDQLFWKIINFSKNKCSPEEWAIHNYWNHKLKNKSFNDHISILYIILNKEYNFENIKKINLKDYLFLRVPNNISCDQIKYILKYLFVF